MFSVSFVAKMNSCFVPVFRIFHFTELPRGPTINEYKQILWGLDGTYTRGKTALRLEIFHDTWDFNVQRWQLAVGYSFPPA